MAVYVYKVSTITGGCCINRIKGALRNSSFSNVTAHVNAATQTVLLFPLDSDARFHADALLETHQAVIKAIEDVGDEAKFQSAISEEDDDTDDASSEDESDSVTLSHKFKAALGLLSGFAILFLPLIFPVMPLMATVGISLFSLSLTLGLGWPFYYRAYAGLLEGRFGMDTLFSISTLVILGVSVAALFFPALPMMFEAGLLIFGFRHAGIAISDAFKAALVRTRRFQDDAPQYVTRDTGEKVLLKTIQPGDKLLLSAGEILPVDGVFESGYGTVSHLYQTGSDQEKALVLEKMYEAGTKLVRVSEPVIFRATASAKDSFLAREDRAILEAKKKRAEKESQLQEEGLAYWLQYFVPAVLLTALVLGAVVGVYFSSWVIATQCVEYLLMAACPCILGVIAPLVTQVGLSQAEDRGIAFREFDHFTVAANIDVVMFDLNGTVTTGRSVVINPQDRQDLLQFMAHLEGDETHRVAKAIKASVEGAPYQGDACTCIESTHYGRRVLFQGEEYAIGNRTMMESIGIAPEALDVKLGHRQSAVYLARGGELVDYVVLEDEIRPGAAQVMRELQARGKKVCFCSGSDKATVEKFATALNVPVNQVFADCTVEGENSKESHLKALQAKGHKVAFVGDAGNDARVIASSNLGLVMAHAGGHVGAQQGASAVLHTESLLPVLDLFDIAERTDTEIMLNIGFSFLYNLAALALPMVCLFSFGLVLHPAIAAGLMMLQTLLVFAHVYWFASSSSVSVDAELEVDEGLAADEVEVGDDYGLRHGFKPASTPQHIPHKKGPIDDEPLEDATWQSISSRASPLS